jgi:hypothetical protein
MVVFWRIGKAGMSVAVGHQDGYGADGMLSNPQAVV